VFLRGCKFRESEVVSDDPAFRDKEGVSGLRLIVERRDQLHSRGADVFLKAMRTTASENAIFSAGSALRRIVNEEVVDRHSASHDILTRGPKEMKQVYKSGAGKLRAN
jgi:hypothetical protein